MPQTLTVRGKTAKMRPSALGALGLSGRCDMDKADAGGKTPADWARRSNDENALYVLREAKPETAYGRNIFQAKPEKPEP